MDCGQRLEPHQTEVLRILGDPVPYIDDVPDITAYWALSAPTVSGPSRFNEALASTLAKMQEPARRFPLVNLEPRVPIDSRKRAIIHARDGHQCRYCGTYTDQMTVDHIVPRSAFRIEDLTIADRSDNLASACLDCNQDKSNFEHPMGKRLGVVAACWGCLNPEPENWWELEGLERPELPVPVFCYRCGITSHVPTVKGWVL